MRVAYPGGSFKPLDVACQRAVTFFDKIGIRAAHWLDAKAERFLRANSKSCDRFDSEHPLYYPEYGWSFRGYCIVAPNQRARDFLAGLPDKTFHYNRLEPAVDLAVDYETKTEFRDLFDFFFVQSWHNQETKHFDNGGTATGRRGLWFVWYDDKRSKVIPNAEHVFHFEARLQGKRTLSRHAGIERMRDLTRFDHAAFWQRKLSNSFFEIDLQRLGRHADNKLTNRRRRELQGRDLLRGSLVHADAAAKASSKHMTAQHLVDHYGRGTYLRKADVSFLTRLIVNGAESIFHPTRPPYQPYSQHNVGSHYHDQVR